ncbi:MAG TPA: phosphoribosyltransferase family protein, partial [Terriglobales bacterium]|nr:phosphoribosyltransferase family protein [Terriglobales bacterium]
MPVSELQVLISRQQIAQRVSEMAAQITRDFAGQPVIFVGVLKGAAIFLSDLARQVPLDSTFDFIGVCSYGQQQEAAKINAGRGWDSTGEVRLTKDVEHSMAGKNVLLVEDILDTGLTLTYIKKLLLNHQPKS